VLNADNRQIRLLLVTTVFTEENPEPA